MIVPGLVRTCSCRFLVAAFMVALLLLGPKLSGATAADPDPFFGVISQSHLRADDFDRMESGRIGSYRMPVAWGQIEPQADGGMKWTEIDEMVELTAERRIDFLPTLYNSPWWLAANHRTLPVTDGYAIRRWKNFVGAAVSRYGRDGEFWAENPQVPYRPVEEWQIWNEPNIRYFASPVSPRRYGHLVKISAAAIRRIDPDATVVLAGLYARPPTGTGIKAGRFLALLYRIRGFKGSFDVAAIHPYAGSTGKSIRRTFPLRGVLDKHRDGRKRLIITELGWGSDSATAFGTGSTQAQATQLGSVFRALLRHRERLNLDRVFWFSWSDLPPHIYRCAFCQQTGLFNVSGQPKPAWFRLLDFTDPYQFPPIGFMSK